MFHIRMNTDLNRIEQKVSDSNIRKGKSAMANQILIDTDKYVPMSGGGGALRASAHVEAGGDAISWNTVYARAQFYGTNGIAVFKKYTTPGTGKQWYDKSAAVNTDKWKRVAAKGMGF